MMQLPRRQFIRQSIGSFIGYGLLSHPLKMTLWDDFNLNYDQLIHRLIQLNDQRIQKLIHLQIQDSTDKWSGGLTNGFQIPNAHSTTSFIVSLVNGYVSDKSIFYQSKKVLAALDKAIDCMLRVQHADGSIDLYSTNFQSPPDTAFIINDLVPVYQLLKQSGFPAVEFVLKKLGDFILKTGQCLSQGGIHTPNHRWVVCAALAKVHALFPNTSYLKRIEDWLGEGIDQDQDGQYTERSVSIYSPICNNMFITLIRLLEKKELMSVVRKNLEMTLYYIQPGGEVLTDASGRQDSSRVGDVSRYYYAYRYFAIKDQNAQFAAVCRFIESNQLSKIISYLAPLREDVLLKQALPTASTFPTNYFKYFIYSGVLRIRRGEVDLSIIENNPTFLTFRKGAAILQSIRLHAAFYGNKGQFKAEALSLEREQMTLAKSITHGYFQPFPKDKLPDDGDWEKMPRESRQMSEVQTLNYQLVITENKGKVSIDISITGVDEVPVSMELSFRKGGILRQVSTHQNLEDTYFLEADYGTYRVGQDQILFGPGLALHQWTQMRGMLPKQKGNSVYLTGFTPFKHRLELK